MASLVRRVSSQLKKHFDPSGDGAASDSASPQRSRGQPPAVCAVLGCEPRLLPMLESAAAEFGGGRCRHVSGQGPGRRPPRPDAACAEVLGRIDAAAKKPGCEVVLLSGVDDIAVNLDGMGYRKRALVSVALQVGVTTRVASEHFAWSQRLERLLRPGAATVNAVLDIARDAAARHAAVEDVLDDPARDTEQRKVASRVGRLLQYPETLTALRAVATNIVERGVQGRYGTIHTGSSRFAQVMGQHHDAMGLLRYLGFREGREEDEDGEPMSSRLVHTGHVERARVERVLSLLDEAEEQRVRDEQERFAALGIDLRAHLTDADDAGPPPHAGGAGGAAGGAPAAEEPEDDAEDDEARPSLGAQPGEQPEPDRNTLAAPSPRLKWRASADAAGDRGGRSSRGSRRSSLSGALSGVSAHLSAKAGSGRPSLGGRSRQSGYSQQLDDDGSPVGPDGNPVAG